MTLKEFKNTPWRQSDFKLSNGKNFSIAHNVNNTKEISAALDNWLARTEDISDKSFCKYINDKRKNGLTDHYAYTMEEWSKLTPKNFQ